MTDKEDTRSRQCLSMSHKMTSLINYLIFFQLAQFFGGSCSNFLNSEIKNSQTIFKVYALTNLSQQSSCFSFVPVKLFPRQISGFGICLSQEIRIFQGTHLASLLRPCLLFELYFNCRLFSFAFNDIENTSFRQAIY